jgi:hypothetical protein
MAVFRLRETSKRLDVLAKATGSAALGTWLRSMSRQLDAQAMRASSIVEGADDGKEAGAVELRP